MDETIVLDYIFSQAPHIAILALIAWRLETRVSECIEHHEKVIERLLNGKH